MHPTFENGKLFKQRYKILFPNGHNYHFGIGPINEKAPLIITHVEPSDNGSLIKLHSINLFFVYFVSDGIST